MRGRETSMFFQNLRAALNPIRNVGRQSEDVLRQHGRTTRADAQAKAIAALEAVKIHDAAERYHADPFVLSGGMCPRIVIAIAIAIACDPKLRIADESTPGLDITTQTALMGLMGELNRERGMSSIVIAHDPGLAAEHCDRLAVMRVEQIVEAGPSAGCSPTRGMPVPLRDIFVTATTRAEAEERLAARFRWARRSKLVPFKRLALTLKDHRMASSTVSTRP